MDSKKQQKFQKFPGLVALIVLKTGYTKGYVSKVLGGKVEQKGQKAKHILKLAENLTNAVDDVQIENYSLKSA